MADLLTVYGVRVEEFSPEAVRAAEDRLTEALKANGLDPAEYKFPRVLAWDAFENRQKRRIEAVPR